MYINDIKYNYIIALYRRDKNVIYIDPNNGYKILCVISTLFIIHIKRKLNSQKVTYIEL